MSTDSDFERRFAAVLDESMRKALSETRSLYESMVEELQKEMSSVKKENEALRSKYNRLMEQRRIHTASQCDFLHLPIREEVSPEQHEKKSPSLAPDSGQEPLQRQRKGSETDSVDSDDWDEADDWEDADDWGEETGEEQSHNSQNVEDLRTQTGSKPFGCTICGKVFHNSESVSAHMKIHESDYPFICTVCDKGWYQKGYLTKHMRVHACSNPLSCKVCGKLFSQSGHLKMHMKSHTRVKPNSCTVCGKIFHNSGDMRTHMAIHTREKPFVCEVCGKGWHHKRYLTTHIRVHTASKPYSCTDCSKKFKKSIELKKHMRMHEREREAMREAIAPARPHKGEKPSSKGLHPVVWFDHTYAQEFPC